MSFALDHELLLSLNLYRENPCSSENTGLVAEPEELIAGLCQAIEGNRRTLAVVPID